MPKVVAKVETAGKMHEDERIIKAVQFLRIVAVIRYNNILQTKIMNEENYNQALHIHLLLSWAAFLYEGISAFAGAGKVIKDLTYFKNNTPKVKRFFKEHGEVSSYRNRVLGPIRNQAIFHINESVIQTVLASFTEDCIRNKREIVFISGVSKMIADTTYPIADNLIEI